MTESTDRRVLLVDDDQNLLDALLRVLRGMKPACAVTAACGAEKALELIAEHGPFPVMVSDYQMPGMNGVELLCRAKAISRDTVTIMLTGQADLRVACEAVNRGHLFRMLTKPCETATLMTALEDGLELNRLMRAERELLEQTLRGSIQVLADALSLVNPIAFGRALRARTYVAQLAAHLALPDVWQHETAALLCQLGCLSLPPDLLDRVSAGLPLSPDERKLYDRHPMIAKELIGHIPRLGKVAEAIGLQNSLVPSANPAGVPICARLLSLALALDDFLTRGRSREDAIRELKTRVTTYGENVVAALDAVHPPGYETVLLSLDLKNLSAGMVIDEDVALKNGVKVISRGHELSAGMLARLRGYGELKQLTGPFRVLQRRVIAPELRPKALKPAITQSLTKPASPTNPANPLVNA